MSEDVHADTDNILEQIAAVVSAVQDHVNTEEQEQIAAVVAAMESMESSSLIAAEKEMQKSVVSGQWAFPYFDFDTFKKEKLAHFAECRANKIPSHECDDVAMFDEIANATKMAQEYHDYFETQPGYETYLADLGEYYSISGDKEKQKDLAKKFHEKYPSALVNIVDNQPMYVTNPLVAHYYRSQKGVSFADPATFGKDSYGKSILQANANLLNKIAHPELITNTQVASAYLASLWACAGNPLATDDPRCAVSSIYSELIDYYRSKHADYKERKVLSDGIPLKSAASTGFPALRLRPPPPRPCDIQAEPSVPVAATVVPSPSVPAPVPAPSPSAPVSATVVPSPSPSVPVPAPSPSAPVSATVVPSPSAPVPTPPPSVPASVVTSPSAPVPTSSPSVPAAPNLILQADARILSRLRHAPILTKGFGFPVGGRYLIPSPGFGTGIVA